MSKRATGLLLFCIVLFVACTEKEAAIPPVPGEIAHLPVKLTTMGCPGQFRYRGVVQAWQFPGLMPHDNSSSYGLRGDAVAEVPYCREVEVVDYAWSEKDREYYLRIRLPNGVEGWVKPFVFGIRE